MQDPATLVVVVKQRSPVISDLARHPHNEKPFFSGLLSKGRPQHHRILQGVTLFSPHRSSSMPRFCGRGPQYLK